MAYPNETARENAGEEKEMGDLASLMALMQANKNMDLPGLMALCKEKGYDRGFGGEGMFIFVFLLLFLFSGNGWGNLGNRNQEAFAAAAGQNLQDIIGIYDRIAASQNATTSGFTALDTKLCASISETIASVRNQGDRVYDATRTVGDAVRDCCCATNNKLDQVLCKTEGLYGHTSLVGERLQNNIDRSFCETNTSIAKLEAKMDLGFERTQCLINSTAQNTELARLARENDQLKDSIRSNMIANNAVDAVLRAMGLPVQAGSRASGASAASTTTPTT